MKKFLISFLIFLMTCGISLAKDFTFTFDWNANTEPDMAGYALFQRIDNGTYDYAAPIDPTCTIVNGECWIDPTNKNNEFTLPYKITIDIPAVTDLVAVFNKTAQTIDFTWSYSNLPPTTYYWVARATDGDAWSGDSNEVSHTFNLNVTNWKVYKSDAVSGPWTEVLDVPWDGSSSLTASVPAASLPPGSQTFFALVGFTVEGIFSPNSNVVMIDRRPPTNVINLKIKLVE